MSSNLLSIDSRDRRNPNDTSSSFQVFFDDLLSEEEKIISIESLIISKSYYAINEWNETFTINATPVTLTRGNYSASAFIAHLKVVLDATAIGTFSVTYSTITGKLSISINAGTFTITSNTKNYNYLGMVKSTTVTSVLTNWVSPGVIDLGSTPYIDILVDVPMNSVNTTGINRNILARIPANTTDFTTIFYSTSNFNFVSLLTTKFSSLRISLVDVNNDLVDLNLLDWSMVLNVKSVTNKSLN